MKLRKSLVVLIASSIAVVTARNSLISILDTDEARESARNVSQVPIEGQITFPELAQTHDLECKEHDVVTDDGYLLRMYQIPGNPQCPVLLVHGFLGSSVCYIVRGASSIVVGLSKARGCDVWVANLRGNSYSRRHQGLDPDRDSEFWDFSITEYGNQDLPAIIDYILHQTGQKRLRAIAHGEGAASFFVMGSMLPEYNKKVGLLVAMAPIGPAPSYSNHLTAQILRVALNSLQQNELFGADTSLMIIFKSLCAIPSEMTYKLCSTFVSALSGNGDYSGFDSDFLPRLVGHYPAGTSKRSAMHIVQIMENKKFAQFDYGNETNLLKYNSRVPPEYDLSRVTMPVALVVAEYDKVSTPSVVRILRQRLPNIVDYYISDLEYENAHHMDFLWGSPKYLYLVEHILRLITE